MPGAPPGAACPDDICRVTTRSEKRRQFRHQQGGRGGQPAGGLQRDILLRGKSNENKVQRIDDHLTPEVFSMAVLHDATKPVTFHSYS